MFGAPIKLVAGYPGTNEIALAMERGEVEGLCGLSWSTIKTRHAQWLKDKKMNLIVQASFKKVPEIGDGRWRWSRPRTPRSCRSSS